MAPYTRQARTTGLWSGQYRDATGRKRYTSGHRTRREAERAAVLEGERCRRGRRRDPRSYRMTYAAWVEQWWPARGVEDSTARSDWPRMRLHVLPRWGSVRLCDIARLDVQAWVLSLVREPQGPRQRTLAASTARSCYHLLARSLREAVAEDLLDISPCREIRLPDLPIPDERFLTDDEVTALFRELDGPARLLAELLLDTGMRMGEAAGLHRSRCHLEGADPFLEVVEVFDPDFGVMRPHPKGKHRRQVPVSLDVARWLLRHWENQPFAGDCGTRHEDGRQCRSGLALTTASGRPFDRHNFANREWAAAAAAAGVEATPHDLRHTYASRLITAGVPLERLQVLMGHASFQTTLRYARLMDQGHDEVRRALRPVGGHTGRPADELPGAAGGVRLRLVTEAEA